MMSACVFPRIVNFWKTYLFRTENIRQISLSKSEFKGQLIFFNEIQGSCFKDLKEQIYSSYNYLQIMKFIQIWCSNHLTIAVKPYICAYH